MKAIEPGHIYELDELENTERKQTVSFVSKFNLETNHDGTTNEEVLKMLIDRMKYLQGKFACRENALATTKLEEALMWMEYRTARRKEQGVEGKNLPHSDK